MFNIIPLIIILIALAVILYIVFKKLPLLANFDVKSIPKEQQSETKEKIIDERIQRKAKFFYGKLVPKGQNFTDFWKEKIKTFQKKLSDLDDKYKKKVSKESLVTKEEYDSFEDQLDRLVEQAEEFIEFEDYDSAEQKYIEIISLDPKNVDAYRGLAELYIIQKSFDEAKQTYEHILKLNKDDSLAYIELAELYLKTEESRKAKDYVEKALKIEPNNPKFLDLLLSISIIRKDKFKAEEVLAKLKKANPDNKKIKEFQSQIKEL